MALYDHTAHIFGGHHIGLSDVVLTLSLVFIVSRVIKYWRGLQAVSYMPGLSAAFGSMELPGAAIPTSWWNPGFSFHWIWRKTLYKQFGNDTISLVPFIFGTPGFYTSNLDVARQVASSSGGRSFIKPQNASLALLMWGMNLVAAEGDVWRKHRRIMGPAFTNDLYKMVWKETLQTYRDMVEAEGYAGKNEVTVPVVQALTFKLALLVIGRCGFGFPFSWSDPAKTPEGKMSVQEALRIVADTHMIATFVPRWIRKSIPTQRMRDSLEAQDHLMAFMRAQVAERKRDLRATMDSKTDKDAFTMLVKASEDEGGKFQLDDSELIGNVYIMLFAGHETTAHSIAATLGFLSIYEDLQEEIYDNIISVVGAERDPVYDDYTKLDKVLCAFFEALRMFPAGHIMIREAFEDTMLQLPKPHGEEGETITLPIPKGTRVIVDMVGVQYNPRYFDKPDEYIPSRWKGVAVESEAFSAFSIGPRTCIGRKFATTEVVCFLTMLLRDFKIAPVLLAGETTQQWKDRVLDATMVATLGVNDVPVKFIRRTRM